MERLDLPLSAYPVLTTHKLRFGDMDPNHHINNAAYVVLFETGRTEIIHDPARNLRRDGASFVLARMMLDFLGELHWPGEVTIASGIRRIGNSSWQFRQGIFLGETCYCACEVTNVQIDTASRKSLALNEAQRQTLQAILLRE